MASVECNAYLNADVTVIICHKFLVLNAVCTMQCVLKKLLAFILRCV